MIWPRGRRRPELISARAWRDNTPATKNVCTFTRRLVKPGGVFVLTLLGNSRQPAFMDEALFDRLLYRGESETLDFKVGQYSFVGATDEEKSELLKDILAFANAWRDVDAYILIGVAEIKGGKSRVDGITTHLADHELQQFVNAKTNRPVAFQHYALSIEGKQCGAIQIPVQKERPFYLLKDFGKLKAFQVPIRRGSSTDYADPDEVAKMGKNLVVAPAPGLEIEIKLSYSVIGQSVFVMAKAWVRNNPRGITAHDVVVHLKEIPLNWQIDYGVWAERQSNHDRGKWISKYPLNPGDQQILATWTIGQASVPLGTVVSMQHGSQYVPQLMGARVDKDWEMQIHMYAKDQPPALFMCAFAKQEIEASLTKIFYSASA